MVSKNEINRYILESVRNGKLDSDMSLTILKEINKPKQDRNEDIAIIGMSCRFPCANSLKEYWYNLKCGVEVIGNLSEERKRDAGIDVDVKAGWLESISGFDAGFFRISPKEATLMHPSQRLFLENAWEVLEDAGYANNNIYGANIGVFVGTEHTFQMEYNKLTGNSDVMAMSATMTSVMASRISYVLNLHGPSLVVDTACSSGLVTTHLACMSIRNKECKMAIAGGINILKLVKTNFDAVESDSGKLSAFDKNSNGTVWGEGLGFILLKPLDQALKDRDNIYAVIKGSAINNDGTTTGITAPNAETQSKAIVSAWENAGINPETISYIEAHAAGTVLGDPIEVKGIKTAFEKFTDRKQFCGIGTVKPNMGHCIGAAAVSSLIKVVLSLKNKQIPPNINFYEPNPFIEFHDSPVYIIDKLTNWESDGLPRRAGVSSFGFSRTNCHMLLEEAPVFKDTEKSTGPYVFVLSARSRAALNEYIKRYNNFMCECEELELKDICFTADTGRMHFTSRLAMVVTGTGDFIQKMKMLSKVDFDDIKDENIMFCEHRLVADNLKKSQPGEISRGEKKELDNTAAKMLDGLEKLEPESYAKILKELCSLYVRGADVSWQEIYKKGTFSRVSLPLYPFEHKRYWIDPVDEKQHMKPFVKEVNHPLIDQCLIRTLNMEVYMTELRADRQWILTEHLVMGMSAVPDTAFLEMAREAGKSFSMSTNVEFRDVVFTEPLMVGKNESIEVHTIVTKENGYVGFKIASKMDTEDEDSQWNVHAEGKIYPCCEKKTDRVDLKQIRRRCDKNELKVDLSKPVGEFWFGMRWRKR